MTRLLIALLFVAGCAHDPVSTSMTSNPDVPLSKLFTTHEGCTVYRFVDDSRYRYFADCRGSVTWDERCGKGCTADVEVPTSR